MRHRHTHVLNGNTPHLTLRHIGSPCHAIVISSILFRKYFLRVQEETNLIPDDQEVESCYLTNRTPRKMAVTRLERAGFADEFIDRMNRWRAQEQSKGRTFIMMRPCCLLPRLGCVRTSYKNVGETELVTLPGKGRRVPI